MLIAEPYTAIPCGEIAVTVIMWSPIPASFPPTLSEPSEVSVTKPVIYVGMATSKSTLQFAPELPGVFVATKVNS